jgi:methyl-accepting chemotaxis protein
VKNLAAQPADATEQIASQVATIQSATGETVAAITQFDATVREIAETAVAGETDAGAETALAAAAALQEQAVSLKGNVASVWPWFETALRASSP